MRRPDHVAPTTSSIFTGWVRDIAVATRFLTRLPLGGGGREADGSLAAAARTFPVVGAGIGLAAAVVLHGASGIGLYPLAAALAALAASALLTGALHEDGLADVADGFGAGTTPARTLEIMSDSRIGSFGVLALVFAVGLKAGALAGMSGPGLAAAALIAAGAASRAALPAVMYRLDVAKADGLAHAAGRPSRDGASIAAGLGALATLFLLGWSTGLVALAAAAVAGSAVALLARRRIGGYTGDVLGAVQQAAETAFLLAASAVAS